jgi:DNA-binding response OmpR family regulator
LRIDPVAREVRVGKRKIQLSAKEFALLRMLATEPTRVFTNEHTRAGSSVAGSEDEGCFETAASALSLSRESGSGGIALAPTSRGT